MKIHFISSVIMALFRHSKLLGDVHLIVFFLLDILSFSISDYEIETFLDFHQSVFCKAKPNHMLQVHKYNFSIQTLICCAITVAHVGGEKRRKIMLLTWRFRVSTRDQAKNGTTPKTDDVAFKVGFFQFDTR